MKKLIHSSIVLLVGAGLSTGALAHAGHEQHSSFMTGLLHPLTGWDHLAALLLVGVFVAVSAKKAAFGLIAFVSFMLVAGFTAGVYWSQAHSVEGLVLASLFALPVCLLLYLKTGALKALALMALGIFSACHGVVQGAEAYGALVQYAGGTLLSSVAVMASVALIVKAVVGVKRRVAAVAQ
ncbi:HupE/UreJ family protein [Reinekea marinisedimentorum]|uniref:Urease accessory protein n=1 Tax=Reinekea marinisedimentorum TaxID=230495 RepID=A0A4R3I1B8_9GAMM|nr:HupE/UreJ family protein [Reinekea marinisedimentorum]TCS38994.1 urease accessory protein [Reinekea marinisedimentorum]